MLPGILRHVLRQPPTERESLLLSADQIVKKQSLKNKVVSCRLNRYQLISTHKSICKNRIVWSINQLLRSQASDLRRRSEPTITKFKGVTQLARQYIISLPNVPKLNEVPLSYVIKY